MIKKLINFIEASPSPFHAVETAKEMLAEAGFTELREAEQWTIEKGGRYFVTRNQSSIAAFAVPANMEKTRFMIAAAHTDSPTFKIKDTPELTSEDYVRINAERYGGMIYDSWFDRPLSVAGRVIVRTESGVRSVLVDVDRDLLMIPHIAIHMENPNAGKEYNPASDLVPLFGDGKAKDGFMTIIAEAANVKPEDILAHELFLVNRQKPAVWGKDGEFLSAPRLDDLECMFAATQAIIDAKPEGAVAFMLAADNEEVGSQTKQGAGSTFAADVMSRICEAMDDDFRSAVAESMMLSADNAHAVHPNAPALADPTHRPKMNGGVVLKFAANQKYTTDAVSAAVFRQICQRADVPVQTFANRSDKLGGGTLGNVLTRSVSLSAVDIGLAQLAMHSSYETAGTRDAAYMVAAMKQFYESALIARDGEVTIR